MRSARNILLGFVIAILSLGMLFKNSCAIEVDQKAPYFELKDLKGSVFKLKDVDQPFVVVCFFAPFSKASEESLRTLEDLKVKYGDDQVLVLAITRASKEDVTKFVGQKRIKVRVLLDPGDVSKLYGAQFVLPVTFILGPELKVLDKVQGGGQAGVKLLLTLAKRELERKRINVAKGLAKEALKKSKKNPEPRAILAYANLKEGKIDEAENDFREMASLSGEASKLGKEGLAHVYWVKGDEKKAWRLANEVSDRGSVHVIKGDILYSQGNIDGAVQEYGEATKKKSFPFQAATPYNKLGRVYASKKNYNQADKLFERALKVDPYSIEALSNKGVLLEKEGKWKEAHDVYKKASRLDVRDEISLRLLQRAEEMLKLAKDAKRSERIDRLVKELVKRYKENKGKQKVTDEWTSRPMVVAFLGIDERGLITERAGIPELLVSYLGIELANSGRVRVVERALLDKLLAELNLGSSDLADQNTSLRLGRILAAKLLASGILINEPGKAFLSLRMIDSETSSIPIVYSNSVNFRNINALIHQISSRLLSQIVARYPLRGYVIQREGDQVLLNLGSGQGVKIGMRFALLRGGKPIEFKGRILKRKLQKVGEIEISSVEPDVSYARIINVTGAVEKEMKIREIVQGGGGV